MYVALLFISSKYTSCCICLKIESKAFGCDNLLCYLQLEMTGRGTYVDGARRQCQYTTTHSTLGFSKDAAAYESRFIDGHATLLLHSLSTRIPHCSR
jgi:hypothetical protein